MRKICLLLALFLVSAVAKAEPAASPHKILFFTKSSGYEHSVISWKKGQPAWADRILQQLGDKNGWQITVSKDGSLFSKEYLAQFDLVFFYTTGDLFQRGTDGHPPMTPEGRQSLFDFVRNGKGFVGAHAASDTFHSSPLPAKDGDHSHGDEIDPYIRFLGGEFLRHGAQQEATNKIISPEFPGFGNLGDRFTLHEEWYAMKNFSPDIHALTVIETAPMKGDDYKRPPYPTTWARREGQGRVWYTSIGHREDTWANPLFQQMLIGGIRWALGDAKFEIEPNLKTAAPESEPQSARK